MKSPVTREVIRAHLEGEQPYGVYLLVQDRIEALAIDFDKDNPDPPQEFVATAKNYGLPSYIERSKSKAYHVWMFMVEGGVLAAKARAVACRILEEIGEPNTEVFPKQNVLSKHTPAGNFINAPLFGALVPRNRTVFLNENAALEPYPDQWEFLESIKTISETTLDGIIETNDPLRPRFPAEPRRLNFHLKTENGRSFGLPICARRMLSEGVRSHQRVACFRLAVQLRKAGLPYDIAVTALKTWASKNQPQSGKRVITEHEIVDQTAWAYTRPYQGCGCEDTAVAWFCDPTCHLYKKRKFS